MNFEEELDKLVEEGENLCGLWKHMEENGEDITFRVDSKSIEGPDLLKRNYQKFYTIACRVLELLAPERLEEFKACYIMDEKRSENKQLVYTLHDFFHDVNFWEGWETARDIAFTKLSSQVNILTGCKPLIGSVFQDIERTIRSNLIDSEISAGERLIMEGQLRAAGSIYNVAAERHLQAVCEAHSVKVNKGDVKTTNDALKKAGVINSSQWNKIKRIVDLRKLCYHNTGTEPTKDDLDEFTENVKWLVKQVQ